MAHKNRLGGQPKRDGGMRHSTTTQNDPEVEYELLLPSSERVIRWPTRLKNTPKIHINYWPVNCVLILYDPNGPTVPGGPPSLLPPGLIVDVDEGTESAGEARPSSFISSISCSG